jgi:hypothetical protein
MLRITEEYHLLEVSEWFNRSSTAIAVALNLIYLFIKTYRDGVFDDPDFIAYSSQSSSSVVFVMQMDALELVLIALSLLNTWCLFASSKSVVLFHQPTQPRYPGDRSWRIRSRNARLVKVDTNTEISAGEWNADTPYTQQPRLEDKWVLKVWTPQVYLVISLDSGRYSLGSLLHSLLCFTVLIIVLGPLCFHAHTSRRFS